jgi:hypothetical protein
MPENSLKQSESTTVNSALHITKLVCCGVIVLSILLCVVIAAIRSNGLNQIKVTALKEDAEPRDHGLPFVKQKDALPDYEIKVNLRSGQSIALGAKPNTSAINGLTWTLNEPVSVSEVVSIRLQEQDKMVSDAIVEVQVVGDTVSIDNYKFEFSISRSLSVGVQSFFRTPIGMAIVGAFFVAMLLIILPSVFAI